MITKIVKIDEQNIDYTKLLFASQIIKKGGIIAFPTDTIYGLGCDVFNLQSIRTLFKLKQRPTTKPLAILVCSKEQVKEIAIDIPNK
ncbi:MAG: L-threonylcarbamoyladenylate synthase, partial [Candidatus Heimdallarchaeaceae archaeon]